MPRPGFFMSHHHPNRDDTLPETIIEVESGPCKDDVPLQAGGVLFYVCWRDDNLRQGPSHEHELP